MERTPTQAAGPPADASARGSRGEVARLFLWLGVVGFGGPAAHVALMRDEVVRRRRWLDDATFLDLVGVTSLIPGPNSTELAMLIGHRRAGWAGLVAAGGLFTLPAMLLVLGAAWVYERYGSTPSVAAFLYGVKPVVVVVVAYAAWSLARAAVRGPWSAALAAAVAALALAGANELALLVGGGAVVLLARSAAPRLGRGLALVLPASAAGALVAAEPFSLLQMTLTLLKIGAILYGSGYVLLAYLRADFVERLGWLTDQQLLDAVAVGQFTPGPVLTTATFVGYLLAGLPGGLLATAAIFLPSFVFVALSARLVPRLRSSPLAGAALDGVNLASLGLMAAVTLTLGRAAVVDPLSLALALAATALQLRTRVGSAWLILGGGLVGLAARLVAG